MRSIGHIANELLRIFLERRVRYAYQRKLRLMRKRCPAFFMERERVEEAAYRNYWSRFGWRVGVDWYRYYRNRSGKNLLSYVPNDVYYCKIERALNDPNQCAFWANKNLFEKHFGIDPFPKTYVRVIFGSIYDGEYNEITIDQARSILISASCDVVLKIAEESCGGHGLTFYLWRDGWLYDGVNSLDLRLLVNAGQPCLLQKIIRQAEFCSRFNPSSVNTFRVVTLRRPKTGEVVVLKRILRIGVGPSKVDNQSSGGISVGIFDDGRLNCQAFDRDGVSFENHPTTGIRFSGQHYDMVTNLNAFAVSIARGVPSLRLLSLDIAMCDDGSFKCIEVNTYGMQIDFLQTFDGGMFDPYTEEVIDYCLERADRSAFRYIRGFYF